MSKISIIIPVYWNSDTLMALYEDMKEKILHKLGDYEIVMVDDGSGDNSWEIMNQIKDMDSNVKLVKLSRNFGEHAALLAGLSHCTGDCAVTKQADLQEDSELILEMYDKWKEGNKVVMAIREERDDPAMKKFFAGLYYLIVRKYIMPSMPQGGCDCYLIDRQVIEVIEMLDVKNGHTTIKITIHEGKNRQVRKMFDVLGYTVVGLQRISIGQVELGNLPLGRWRHLTSHEINCLLG